MKALICSMESLLVKRGSLEEVHPFDDLPWDMTSIRNASYVVVLDTIGGRARFFKNRFTGVAEIVARVQFDAWMWGE